MQRQGAGPPPAAKDDNVVGAKYVEEGGGASLSNGLSERYTGGAGNNNGLRPLTGVALIRQFERESQLARTRKSGAADVVFEGVVIPKGTRSAKLAKKGITNEEEMGKFLTSVFADTLNGKIILPKPKSGIGVPRILNGLEQKLRRGLTVGIQAKGDIKRPRRPKAKS